MRGTKQTDRQRFSWTYLLVAVLLATGIYVSVRADEPTDEDPPARVARLNFLQGAVSFEPAGGGDNDWVCHSQSSHYHR
jgi:hypothetical protein